MDTTESRRRNRGLSLICLSIIIIILIAGLWPFEFRPKNNVSWINGENGIHFGRRGIAYSRESVFGPQGAIRPGRPISIELVVLPARESKYSLMSILTFYGEGSRQFFTIAQWRSHLVLRSALQGNDLRSNFREMGAKDVLQKNILRFLTVTSRDGDTKIYIDGKLIKETNNFHILPEDSMASGKLVLGNSPTGKNQWTGELAFLSAYDSELSPDEAYLHFQDWIAHGIPGWSPRNTPSLLYLFDERAGVISRNQGEGRYDLLIPETFQVLEKNILRPPWQEKFNRSFIRDDIVNIFGFLPFGFFFAMWLRNGDGLPSKSHFILIAMLGGSTSLTIELLQAYLPSRASSLTDVFCNIFGTILGIYIFRWIILSLSLEKRP